LAAVVQEMLIAHQTEERLFHTIMGRRHLPSPNQWPPFVVVDLNFLDPIAPVTTLKSIVCFTEVAKNPYAWSVRLISEPHSGQTSFWASAIFRNVK